MSAQRHLFWRSCCKTTVLFTIVTLFLSNTYLTASVNIDSLSQVQHKVFPLNQISAQQAKKYLAELKMGTVSQLRGTNALLITAQPPELAKAIAVLKIVDCSEKFVINEISPTSVARNLPSNEQIAAKLGDISIGTFSNPPNKKESVKAIIDIHNGVVLAIAPSVRITDIQSAIEAIQKGREQDLTQPVELNKEKVIETQRKQDTPLLKASDAIEAKNSYLKPESELQAKQQIKPEMKDESKKIEPEKEPILPIETSEFEKTAIEPEAQPVVESLTESDREAEIEQVMTETEQLPGPVKPVHVIRKYEPGPIQNGEETLRLNLPERLSIVDLLGLVGEYLHLDYMYDPTQVTGEVTLKLQGKLRGPIKVKELYPLLESVLKFRGFVMTRKDNLVTVVKRESAFEIDPALVGPEKGRIEHGDVVVTRIFELKHIGTDTATKLLTEMKLGGTDAVTMPETRTLIVTDYAYRMSRIEDLLEMIDKPGEPRLFRFRQLKYTMAKTLAQKVQTLTEQLGTVSISISAPAEPVVRPGMSAAERRRAELAARQRAAAQRAQQPEPAEPSVYLDADERTNRILMIGLEEQLTVVDDLINALDVEQQDLRTLKLYKIEHVEAEEVKNKLQELGIIGGAPTFTPRITAAQTQQRPTARPTTVARTEPETEPLVEEPQVVTIETTNSILVNATPEQHAQIDTIIDYVDSATLEEEIPYKLYPLENSSPDHVAEVLENLIAEKVRDEEEKAEKVIKKQEKITIVPDPNTFSLIVYASKKNQEWIGNLIKQLDKRRPQVLIDVTLVEVTRTDQFDLDIQLASKFPKMEPNGTMDFVGKIASPFIYGTSAEVFSSPKTSTAQGFYSDRHIQALVTAMQSKSYGRVLAKPKILVNDGQPGIIMTEDITNVKLEEFISGGPDKPDRSVPRWEPYNAGINLTITPNISEGDLLLLKVELERSDFGETPEAGAPPDKTTSNINTVVTVPNNRTIILGGLLRLNQGKGGTKVPILGDIPILGGLFRSTSNSARDSKLYIFVKANILRPHETLAGLPELERISEINAMAFEKAEEKFQKYQSWPGIKEKPMDPEKVLEAQ